MKKSLSLISLISLAGLIIILFGCSNPEEHPAFKKVVKDISNANEEISQIKGRQDKLQSDIELILDDVDRLKRSDRSAGEFTAKITEIEQRIAKIEESLKEVKRPAPKDSSSVEKKSSVKSVSEEPAPKPKGFYYTVKKGDTIESIAKQFNIPAAKLLRDNNFPKDKKILPNQQIYIIK